MSTETSHDRAIQDENVQAGPLQAYLARPADRPAQGENLPAVIVIHEIFGLNDDIRDIARRFAREGYIALAVDLYSSKSSRVLCIMRVVLNMLRNPLAAFSMYDLDAAIEFLQRQDGIDKEQIGVIGFCMGGGYALALAVHNQQVRAASVFYGRNPDPITSLEKACPVVASYGADDKMFARQGQKLEEVMRQYGRPVDVKVYEGAGHSFFNQHGKEGGGRFYRPEAAADAWQRTLRWFGEYLPKKDA